MKYKPLDEVYSSGTPRDKKTTSRKKYRPLLESYQRMLTEEEEGELTHTISIDNSPPQGITDDEFEDIKHLLHDRESIQSYISILGDSGIPKKHALHIIKKAIRSQTPDQIFSYIANKTVTLEQLVASKSIFAAFPNIDPDFFTDSDRHEFGPGLGYTKWLVKGKGMGSGEVFSAVMLKDAVLADSVGKKGDTVINGVEIEVKADNGRLKGQHGYGSSENANRYWLKHLKQLASQYKVDASFLPPNGTNEFNFMSYREIQKKPGGLPRFYQLGEQIFNSIDPTWYEGEDDIAAVQAHFLTELNQIMKDGLQQTYFDMDVSWIDRLVTSMQSWQDPDVKMGLWIELFRACMRYYMNQEKIGSILTFTFSNKPAKAKGSVGYITANDISAWSKDGDFGVWVTSPPQFGAKAASQGMAWGITAAY